MNEFEKYPFPQGKPDHPSFTLLDKWWHQLENDKGERAALRRAASLTEVMLSPAFHSLLNSLRRGEYGIPENRYPNLAAIAGLAARVRVLANLSLATRMGRPKSGGSSPTFSELRLRRVLACNDIEELYTLLRRAVALLDDQADLADLAATVWHWSPLDDKRANDPRRRIAYDYYANAPIKA